MVLSSAKNLGFVGNLGCLDPWILELGVAKWFLFNLQKIQQKQEVLVPFWCRKLQHFGVPTDLTHTLLTYVLHIFKDSTSTQDHCSLRSKRTMRRPSGPCCWPVNDRVVSPMGPTQRLWNARLVSVSSECWSCCWLLTAHRGVAICLRPWNWHMNRDIWM